VLRVGLTGGIGSGKSEVARRLAAYGALLVDADLLAREVVAPGTPGLAAVVAQFGAEVLTADGSLDRELLAARVFADEAARGRLNAIVHPLVRAETEKRFAAAPADAVVVNEVPLLVESGLLASYDVIVAVEAPLELRLARLARRGVSEAAATARIAAQASDDERRARADVVIVNDGTVEELDRQVARLWLGLACRAAGSPAG
jgi:dephospho-CoA kinase